ncbi:flavin reductase family protein [Nesterenkonia sp. F]|uniref:flavin reductase family protein n=1 Tax=Nesterenkonia sp. F TaxID=795955 RepID=UPI000255D572|nr:flavin reductase family protein [Nesterenkonia sp. F]
MSASAPVAAETPTALDPLQLRRAFSEFPQGVVVVAAEVDGAPEALVASTFTVGVSLDPPLVTFAVQHTSNTWPRLRDGADRLGISVLGRGQHGLCRQIASKDRASRFDGVARTADDDGAIALDGSPLTLTTRVHDQVTAGDHDIVVLEVLDVAVDERDEARPLVFHRSDFAQVHAPAPDPAPEDAR